MHSCHDLNADVAPFDLENTMEIMSCFFHSPGLDVVCIDSHLHNQDLELQVPSLMLKMLCVLMWTYNPSS